jgi:hypothetical protein
VQGKGNLMDLPQLRPYTVNDFQEWDQRDSLVLQPKFQRRLVWLPKPKSYLLDSIVRGFPIPPIYVREILDPDRRKTVREVVDGQQRMQTILDFLDDRLTILGEHNEEIGGMKFSELHSSLRKKILNYPFSVVVLVGADDTDVFRTFERLNSYTLPLTSQEKLNAKFFGKFKQFVFRLGQDHLEFWRSNGILTDRKIVRMAEAELTSELIVAMMAGLQDKKKSLEGYYQKYDDSFSSRRQLKREFESTLVTIQAMFGEELQESAFSKKALFYSLFCAVFDITRGLPASPMERKFDHVAIGKSSFASVRRSLTRLGEALETEAPTPEQVKFAEACARQTDNVGPRRVRHRFIFNAIYDSLKP